MKTTPVKFRSLFIGLLLGYHSLYALDAGVSWAVYATPEKPYLEVNLEIAGASVTFKPIDSTGMQASVEVLILVRNGEAVVNYEKYTLQSPVVGQPRALLDVKRLMLPNGDFTLEVTVQDLNDPENRDFFTCPLPVHIGSELYVSELQLLRDFRPDESDGPFVRNGFYMEPLPFNFYDRAALTLAFYAEIYHSNTITTDAHYVLRFFIEREKGNGITELVVAATQRKRPSTIDAILAPIDISQLESGNYSLTLELRNSVNELLTTKKTFFQRSNPFLRVTEEELTEEVMVRQFVQDLSAEELRYALRAISPLTRGDENEILKNVLAPDAELKAQRFFLFRHFIRIDPNNPEQAYRSYMELAKQVDEKFHSGFRYGFETDRGRIFLRYGSPDDLVHVEDDPAAPPYEIWVYYNFPKTNQKNVKFLFYNPSLAGDDFIVLHSNARGEINNPRWERDLYQRNAGQQIDDGNYHDATRIQSNMGRNARTFFEDF